MLKEFRQRYVLLLFLSVILFLAGSLIGGCTYKSGPKTLTAEREKPRASQLEDAGAILESSIAKTVNEGRKFWFQGWVASKIQKRKTTSMYNQGTFDRDKGFLVKASVLQQHYTYYRWKERVYVFEYGKWLRAANEEMPFTDPFAGFSGLLKAADKFSRLPDEKVMGRECLVLRTELEGAEISRTLPPGMKLPGDNDSSVLLAKAKLVYTIWIDQKENFIYQYRAELTMPVPGAGALAQETYFKFWDYNSPSVQLTEPEKIERYLEE